MYIHVHFGCINTHTLEANYYERVSETLCPYQKQYALKRLPDEGKVYPNGPITALCFHKFRAG